MPELIDSIPPELLESNRIEVHRYEAYVSAVKQATPGPLRTPYPAKNLVEVYGLVKNVIDDYERRSNIADNAKINFTEEQPDYLKDAGPTITFGLEMREPGAMSKGSPMHRGLVRNYAPMFREELDDPENPGFKRAIFGYFHDNHVKFTVWAKTNKVANERALWFEGLMQEYSWYFTSQGVARFLFLKREADLVSETDGQKLYGRPLVFFVRTETLTTISQKTFELLSVNVSVQSR